MTGALDKETSNKREVMQGGLRLVKKKTVEWVLVCEKCMEKV